MTETLRKLFAGAVARAKGKGLMAADAAEEGAHLREAVVLGVLLSEVAKAHDGMSEEEEREVLRILREKGGLSEQDAGLALEASREAAEKSLDLQGFTREVNELPYPERVRVVELLFEVALADKHLHEKEQAVIRKIADLMWVAHKDFIGAKLKVKNPRR